MLLREGGCAGSSLRQPAWTWASTAEDAEQLMSLVTLLRLDVVLTDIRMPPTQTRPLEIRRQSQARP